MLLTRPEDDPTGVWLDASPAALARAAVLAARLRFPIDAGIWLCCEALSAIGDRPLSDAINAADRSRCGRVPDDLRPWLRQLTSGSGWHTADLPRVTMPTAVSERTSPSIRLAAVDVASDATLLPRIIALEIQAVRAGGRRVGELLGARSRHVRRSATA